jgi:hypothetical protein
MQRLETQRHLMTEDVECLTGNMDTEDPVTVKENILIVKKTVVEKYRMGDIGLLDHEAKK